MMLIGKIFSLIYHKIIYLFFHCFSRYMAKTFSQVNNYIKPNWIVYLGDIFDEGLSASDDEFKRYLERFDSIFHYKVDEQRSIIIPGDNDVGGEYYGDKKPMLRQRFRNYFGRNIAFYYRSNIQFLKVLIIIEKI